MPQENLENGACCPLGAPAWLYKCSNCLHEFEMPCPKGPSDEKGRVCPGCRSPKITRISNFVSQACPPGG
jgi:hypothetical protein